MYMVFSNKSLKHKNISLIHSLNNDMLGCILQDKLVAFSCMLPGVTWFGSCAILGTTTSYLSEALRKSEASFQMLISRGIIESTPISELTIAPKRRSGALTNQ